MDEEIVYSNMEAKCACPSGYTEVPVTDSFGPSTRTCCPLSHPTYWVTCFCKNSEDDIESCATPTCF